MYRIAIPAWYIIPIPVTNTGKPRGRGSGGRPRAILLLRVVVSRFGWRLHLLDWACSAGAGLGERGRLCKIRGWIVLLHCHQGRRFAADPPSFHNSRLRL